VKVPPHLLDETKVPKPKLGDSGDVSMLGPKDLFSNATMTKITVVLFYNWIACSIGYYGISLGIGDIGSDVFVSFILVSFSSYNRK